jgi:hypothetical protein
MVSADPAQTAGIGEVEFVLLLALLFMVGFDYVLFWSGYSQTPMVT